MLVILHDMRANRIPCDGTSFFKTLLAQIGAVWNFRSMAVAHKCDIGMSSPQHAFRYHTHTCTVIDADGGIEPFA